MFRNISSKEFNLLPVFVYFAESSEHQYAITREYGTSLVYSQFSICKQGSGIFVDHNQKSHVVNKGDIIYFLNSVSHSYEPLTMPWSIDYILAGGTGFLDFMKYLGFDNSGIITIREDSLKKITELFDSIIAVRFSGEPYSHAQCSQLLFRLMFEISKHINTAAPNISSKKSMLISQCIKYIELNYTADISIASIANELHVSSTYLINTFKEATKMTPQKFLIDLRIKHAKNLLIYQKFEKLSYIAELSGFHSTSYFCTIFKKSTGMTPEAYRAANIYTDI